MSGIETGNVFPVLCGFEAYSGLVSASFGIDTIGDDALATVDFCQVLRAI